MFPDNDQMLTTVTAFFAASEAGDWAGMKAQCSPDVVIWQSVDLQLRSFDETIPFMERLEARMGRWEYRDIRTIADANAVCRLHTVHFARPDGRTYDSKVCAVLQVGPDGLITSIEEYVPNAPAPK